MSLTIRNKSRSQNVYGLKISISADTKGIEFERNSFYVQRLTPGEAITLQLKVTIAEDCTPGQATVSFSLRSAIKDGIVRAATTPIMPSVTKTSARVKAR